MKKNLKRALVLVMAFIMLLTVAGCGGSEESASKVDVSAPNEFPIVKEKTELTVFISKPSMIADIETNEFKKWYEEKTGVHINWDIASGDTQQAINLRLASGDLPDIFWKCGFTPEEVYYHGSQGLFIDLTELIDEHMFYFKDILANREDIKNKITTDGAIYGLPTVLESAGQRCLDKMWVYKPWLDKLGMELPTTTDEFYNMLKAFKEQDPNGNGKADEIPLGGRGIYSDTGIEDYIMNAFTYTDTRTSRIYVENGKVMCSATTEGYREGLRFIKKLYDEGLLLKDVFTIDRTRLTSLGENEGAPILGTCVGQWPGMFTLSSAESGRITEYTSIPPLEGPTGLRQTPRTDITNSTGTAFIVTKDCENPEVAVKWVDWMYSNEGRIKMQGFQGYRESKPGEIALNGKQAKYTYDPVPEEEQNTKFGTVQNETWGANFIIQYFDLEMVSSEKLLDTDLNKMLYYEAVDKYFEFVVDKSYPVLPIDQDVASEYQDLKTTINDAIDKNFVAFVTGEKDLDNDWDEFQAELEGYGLSKFLQLAQERYDKFANK